MTLKRNTRHPNFFLGLASYLFLFVGVVMHASDMVAGAFLIIAALLLGAFHWVTSLFNVATDRNFKNQESRYFWLGTVIMIPPLGGMFYYMIDGRNFSH